MVVETSGPQQTSRGFEMQVVVRDAGGDGGCGGGGREAMVVEKH